MDRSIFKMRKYLKLSILAIILLILSGCAKWELVGQVNGTVVDKEYRPAYTTVVPIFTGKSVITIPQYHPAKYYVYIAYQDLKTVIDDEDLYDAVDIGDAVTLNLYKNQKGNFTIRYESD